MGLSNQAKYYLSLTCIVIAFIGALHGINNLAAGVDLGVGMAWLTASVIFGFAATISFYYYKGRRYTSKSRQQIEVETLAKAGKRRPPKGWHL